MVIEDKFNLPECKKVSMLWCRMVRWVQPRRVGPSNGTPRSTCQEKAGTNKKAVVGQIFAAGAVLWSGVVFFQHCHKPMGWGPKEGWLAVANIWGEMAQEI
mmetsp:Transcript_143/g.368  ORF Transcript_143/g.368 Transcript_143/m.368 type:complete len:101 (-) Transcript_143:1141-1443(-)